MQSSSISSKNYGHSLYCCFLFEKTIGILWSETDDPANKNGWCEYFELFWNMGVGRGAGRKDPGIGNLTFSHYICRRKCRFLSFEWVKWNFVDFGPSGKIFLVHPKKSSIVPPLENIRPTPMSEKKAKTKLKVGITTNWTEFADEPSSQSYLCSVRCLLS